MKKILLSILMVMLVIGLAGCSAKNNEKEPEVKEEVSLDGLKIVAPTGAPSVAFYNHADDEYFETNAAPKNIIAMMADEKGPDFVVIDTVSGSAAIAKGAPYRLAAVLTFGNFYIASTGNDEDGVMNEGDQILLFGEGQTPDLMFHYIYGNEFDEDITYVPAVSDAAAVLQNPDGQDVEGKEYDYIFIAQPVLFASLKVNEKAAVYADIQQLYAEKSGASMIQASLFVNNSVTDATLSAFLSSLESDINAALADPALINAGLSKIGEDEAKAKYGVPAALAMAVVKQNNGLGLGFRRALDIKADIDAFMSVTGREATNEELYR